eukprot:2623769-Pyramimonas_sp.AAC.1
MLSGNPKVDPMYVANTQPLLFWGKALWGNWAAPQQLSAVFQRYLQKEDLKWTDVRGPAGAVICTLRRLGWPPESSTLWKMPAEMPVGLAQLRTIRLRTLIEIGTMDQLGQSLTWEFNDQTFAAPQLDAVAQ